MDEEINGLVTFAIAYRSVNFTLYGYFPIKGTLSKNKFTALLLPSRH